MQVIFLPNWLMVPLFFILWPLFHVSASLLCLQLPDRFFGGASGLFRSRPWEGNGGIYNEIFGIRRWKHLLPDGAAAFKGGYRKKRMMDFSRANLEKYLVESRRAELGHWLSMTPFWVFGLMAPFAVVPCMLVYAVASNLPCIMAQRFNRPRIERIICLGWVRRSTRSEARE
jgi:glycosyl-4,4'-diaponeurosporenoate acyltransferase